MAERRMFAKSIIDSDMFIDMPTSSRLLYYDLSMRADDDGFINNPKKIIRMTGASEDDLRILIAKKFLIPFESGVVVIKHWKIHNYIRNDRYKPTIYSKEKSYLMEDEAKEYFLDTTWIPHGSSLDTVGIPLVSSLDTQVRLGKVRLGKDRLGKDRLDHNTQGSSTNIKKSCSAEFEKFWLAYPKKKAKSDAQKAFAKLNPDDVLLSEILKALEWQIKSSDWIKDNGQYIPNPATYLNGRRWEDEQSEKGAINNAAAEQSVNDGYYYQGIKLDVTSL